MFLRTFLYWNAQYVWKHTELMTGAGDVSGKHVILLKPSNMSFTWHLPARRPSHWINQRPWYRVCFKCLTLIGYQQSVCLFASVWKTHNRNSHLKATFASCASSRTEFVTAVLLKWTYHCISTDVWWIFHKQCRRIGHLLDPSDKR